MLSAKELKALYSCDVIETGDKNILMEEKQRDKTALRTVCLSVSGEFIKISPQFFDRQKEAYRKYDNKINYRLICDGVILYHKQDDAKYLIIVEMKSGFNDVKKAFSQISSSFIKLKTHLECFKSYNASDYNELGIIFCYPPKKEDYNDTNNNKIIKDAKSRMISTHSQDEVDKYLNGCKKELKSYGKTMLDSKAMNITTLPLKTTCLYKKLTILHQPVDNVEASMNLDEILCKL